MSHLRTDIRLNTEAPDSWKVDRLCARLGDGAFRCLVRLWCRVATIRPDGDLVGLSVTDVEGIARGGGTPGAFVAALVDVRLLDLLPPGGTDPVTGPVTDPVTAFVETGHRLGVHQWQEHQPFVCGRPARQASSERANEIKRKKGRRKSLSDKGPTDPVTAFRETGHRNASDPVSPSPLHKRGEESADATAAPSGAPPCAAQDPIPKPAFAPRLRNAIVGPVRRAVS